MSEGGRGRHRVGVRSVRRKRCRNGSDGVAVSTIAGTGNLLSCNRIYGNAFDGIDLGTNGISANDPGDPDVGGNLLQNFPVLAAVTRGAGTVIEGTLDSTPSATYTLEFFASTACDGPGNGEGAIYLGSAVVATGSNNIADFTVTLPTTLAAGQVDTTTATDAFDNTSEFSACQTVLNPPGTAGVAPPLTIVKQGSGIRLDWGATSPSCGGNDYGVFQGTLAVLQSPGYDHASLACTTGGNPTHALGSMPAGNLYFLVAAHTSAKEGSYGTDSAGSERPAGTGACKPRNLAACP